MAAQGVDRLRALPDQQLAHAEDHCRALGLFALDRNKAHSRLADRLSIGGIILLPLDERLHIGRRDQPHVMAQLANFAAVSAATGFHCHDAGGQLAEKL